MKLKMMGSKNEAIGPLIRRGEPLVGSYFVAAYPPILSVDRRRA